MVYPAVRQAAVKVPGTATVIFLHGLGDCGSGWNFLAEEAIRQRRLQHVNFVFPEAPQQAVTLNFGMRMASWYDIRELENVNSAEDEEGVLESVNRLKQIIEEQNDNNIPTNRIIIGGFSQGCAISLATGMIIDRKLAGIVGLSGYLPIRNKLVKLQTDANRKTPIFLGHGTSDNVVKFEFGKGSRDFMVEKLKVEGLEWHQYPGLIHSVSPQEIEDLFQFLERAIPE